MQHTVRDRQTLLDIAIQTSGNIEEVFKIALINNLSITDGFTPGEQVRTSEIIDSNTVTELYTLNTIPASLTAPLDGVGYWLLEENFIVQ